MLLVDVAIHVRATNIHGKLVEPVSLIAQTKQRAAAASPHKTRSAPLLSSYNIQSHVSVQIIKRDVWALHRARSTDDTDTSAAVFIDDLTYVLFF